MSFKQIHFIINPAAGNDEPILSYINTAFQNSLVKWEISVTKKEDDATQLAAGLVGKTDIIAVYGGDGSVAEVARALVGTRTPLAIIPGGTANVLSKELNIPQDSQRAIDLLASGNYKLAKIDAATANDELFFIRVNLGMMADMVLEASRELKDKVGQLAYGITAIKTLLQSNRIPFNLLVDGEEVQHEGVALTVTNCGSIGIGNYTFLPDIQLADGLLDIIVMHKADLVSVLRLAGSTLMHTDSEILEHRQCREVEIRFEQEHIYILDDCERTAKTIRIKILPDALNVLVPQ